jgi:Asp-tRNA(Asn)/Glu-tRNA(Gln) amidotransferase C subunit
MPLRADESRPGLDLESLLKNAPEKSDDQFKVPPVFE